MSLGTLDRSPPPFFRRGPSALSKWIFFSSLSLFLMVVDTRIRVALPIRSVLATALYPLQALALQPVRIFQSGKDYLSSVNQAQSASEQAAKQLALQSVRAGQVEQLAQENRRLRQLLDLREQLAIPVMAAEVLYAAADPYSRKVIIDKGLLRGVDLGSPVLDEWGVLGQITGVYPLVSEVTLLTDRDWSIPVLNVRTGARSVAYGDNAPAGQGLELRFMGSNADVQVGDLLTTSGIDGVYPAGLPVAKISRIERRAESTFAKIYCVPQALVNGARHVIVVKPVTGQIPSRPDAAADSVRAGSKKGSLP